MFALNTFSSKVGPEPVVSELTHRSPPRKAKTSESSEQGSEGALRALVGNVSRREFNAFKRRTKEAFSERAQDFRDGVEARVVAVGDALQAKGKQVFDEAVADVFAATPLPGAVDEISELMQNPLADSQGDSGVGESNNAGIRGNQAPEENVEDIEEAETTSSRAADLESGFDQVSIPSIQSVSELVVHVASRVFRAIARQCPKPAMPECVTTCIKDHPKVWSCAKFLFKAAVTSAVSAAVFKKVF